MSRFRMPQYVVDAVTAKRGRLNVFESFAPAETAFLVVDMQNFFTEGSDACQRIVPDINRLAGCVRDAGGLVVWIKMTVAETEDGPSLFPVYHENFFTPDRMQAHKSGLTRGAHGHALDPALDVHDGDPVCEKRRFSAFIQGSSDLHDLLQARGISNLLIGGTLTNVCCESSARDAMMIGYRVIMVEDCNAARTDEDHAAGLTTAFQMFCDVRSTDDVIRSVLGGDIAATAAE